MRTRLLASVPRGAGRSSDGAVRWPPSTCLWDAWSTSHSPPEVWREREPPTQPTFKRVTRTDIRQSLEDVTLSAAGTLLLERLLSSGAGVSRPGGQLLPDVSPVPLAEGGPSTPEGHTAACSAAPTLTSRSPSAAARGTAAGDSVTVHGSLLGPTRPQRHRISCGPASTRRDFLPPEGLALPPGRDEGATYRTGVPDATEPDQPGRC